MKIRAAGVVWSWALLFVFGASADNIQKADNQYALSTGASWVNGVAPGSDDVASWNGEVAASGNWTYGLGANTVWYGLLITHSASMLTITNDGSTLTLGAGGILFATPTNYAHNCSIFSPVQVSGNQTWNIGNAPFYQWGPVSGAGKLTLTGGPMHFTIRSIFPRD